MPYPDFSDRWHDLPFHQDSPQEVVPRYLASFGYRFNRRYDLAAMLIRLAWVSLQTALMPNRLLELAEDCAQAGFLLEKAPAPTLLVD